MPNNKDYINSYLKENKDRFPKEALVEELKKAGYGEGEIGEGVDGVCCKKKFIKIFSFFNPLSGRKLFVVFLILLGLFTIDFLLSEFNLVSSEFEHSLFMVIIQLLLVCSSIIFCIIFIYYVIKMFVLFLFNKNKTVFVKDVSLLVFISFFISVWFYLDKILAENSAVMVVSMFKLLETIFIIILYLVIVIMLNLVVKKLLIKNLIKKIFIYVIVLMFFTIILNVVDYSLTYVVTKTNIGNPEKIACISSGGRWGVWGMIRRSSCIYKCRSNRNMYDRCIDRNLISDPSCYRSFEYSEMFDESQFCFVD